MKIQSKNMVVLTKRGGAEQYTIPEILRIIKQCETTLAHPEYDLSSWLKVDAGNQLERAMYTLDQYPD